MKLMTNDPAPVAYQRETILTTQQVAEWLQVSEDTVQRLGLPRLKGLERTVRYSAGMVLDWLEGRAA